MLQIAKGRSEVALLLCPGAGELQECRVNKRSLLLLWPGEKGRLVTVIWEISRKSWNVLATPSAAIL